MSDQTASGPTPAAPPMLELEYTILGGVAVRRLGHTEDARITEQTRQLLGRLLLEHGRLVTTESIAAALWGDDDKKSRRNGVQHAVRSARNALGDSADPRRVIVLVGDAYRIVVTDPLWIDAERFKRLGARGQAVAAPQPRAARAMLTEALSAWRGRLLGDLAELPWAAGHALELDRLRDRIELELNEVRLALGEHAELDATLTRQIKQRPFDERVRGQLIRALLGSGRALEASSAYRQAVREIGDVGKELRTLGALAALGDPPDPKRRPTDAGHRPGPDGCIVLCADLDVHDRPPHAAGVGTLCLIVGEHGGVPRPVDDGRLVATFEDVAAALRAARAIASDSRLPARIGIHCGPIIDLGDGVIGSGPGRCWQLVDAAHPGQVLVSAAARELAGAAHDLVDVGEHRFADLGAGERLFELPNPRGARFDAPMTLGRRAHNLPVQPTRFVGRADELTRMSQRMGPQTLLTLVGPGGCGKTRLGLQLAARNLTAFADGAWFVGLAELAAGAGVEPVAATIANQLGVRPLQDETLPSAVIRHLSDRAAVLVLDNCEQVHTACAELVSQLLHSCPRLCVIATSRRPLGVDGEHAASVEPMATTARRPGTLSDAVELLLERSGLEGARGGDRAGMLADAEFICRAFDGLPLAIELAAGQVATRGLAGVATEVAGMLTGDRPLGQYASADPGRSARQHTIESAIAWSYRLLEPREQDVLRRLAVFRGSFGETEARRLAEAGADPADGGQDVAGILASLVNSSMVVVDPPLDGALRRRLLGPIRAFAHAQLDEAGDLEPARAQHAEVFLDVAVQTAPGLFGAREQVSLERLEADHDNLRAALDWYVGHGRSDDALRIVGALWWLWFSHGHLAEGCARVRQVLELSEAPSQARVRALRAGSHLSWWSGDFQACHHYNVALEACAEAIDDAWGRAWAQMGHGAFIMFRNPPAALAHLEESRRRFDELDCPWEAGYALQVTGGARWFGGDDQAAGEAYDDAVEIFAALEHPSVLASTRRGAGLMAARCGHPSRGRAMCEAAYALSQMIGDRAGSAQALNFIAAICRDIGDHETALRRFGEALSLAHEVGELWATCWALDGLAGVALTVGEPELAVRLLAHSGRLASRAGYRQSPHELRLREDDLRTLRDVIGEDEFEHAVNAGELMSIGAAVSSALAFAARHARA